MASSIMKAIGSVSGNQPRARRIIELAAQTFLLGVPVMLDAATGAVKEWDGATIAKGIAGISTEPASNLTTTGTAKTLTFGLVPYQSSGVNIPRGAPMNDGTVGLEVAIDDTLFFAEVGPSQLPVAADVGTQFGMTKDGDGHWYVDRTKVTAGVNTVVIVQQLDPNDTRGVWVRFVTAVCQLAS